MKNLTEPNFKEWSKAVFEDPGWPTENIATALKQAYEQGKALGYLKGYDHGINIGWAELQDADHKWVDSHNEEKDTSSKED